MSGRILIIEDEEEIAELEKDYLEISDFEVEISNNGNDGLKKALDEDYLEGTPFTDAQIFMNMGMAYSSNEEYRKAYDCLTKAESLGLHSPAITKELQWLNDHHFLW